MDTEILTQTATTSTSTLPDFPNPSTIPLVEGDFETSFKELLSSAEPDQLSFTKALFESVDFSSLKAKNIRIFVIGVGKKPKSAKIFAKAISPPEYVRLIHDCSKLLIKEIAYSVHQVFQDESKLSDYEALNASHLNSFWKKTVETTPEGKSRDEIFRYGSVLITQGQKIKWYKLNHIERNYPTPDVIKTLVNL